ncbi:MAG TPA: DUF1454 family protein [Arsenophonus apicola]|uniref:DUF1454 family protein n=1 Tax=Arsenophonus TaxID=637 RepID=UPI001CDC3F01|nr:MULTISPECIES: DUF1454 family protein [Arsenophonus]UBX29090.1 YiiQ family protein [Arsenophonus apicola]
MMKTYDRKFELTFALIFIGALPLFPVLAKELPVMPETEVSVAYLSPDAALFNETIPIFRQKYNQDNPNYPIHEFKVIKSKDISLPYIRAASRINNKIYSSAVLERGSEKIKSLQLTLLPPDGANSYKINRQLFERYVMAIINHFEKTTSINNLSQLTAVLDRMLEQHNQVQSDETIVGAIRYILVKSKDNMITFAIEPVKLSLNDDNITHE